MALEAAPGGEAVLKQPCEQGLFGGEGGEAVANIPRWKHPQFPAQDAAAATVIRHGDHCGDVAAVALQAAQQGGQARTATDGDDVGTAVQSALGP